VFVQAAPALEAEEAGVFLARAVAQSTGGVHVADGDVALLPQRVIGQVMAGQIAKHVTVGPVDQRMDLAAAVAPQQHVEVLAAF
jgi:hypothetical protein